MFRTLSGIRKRVGGLLSSDESGATVALLLFGGDSVECRSCGDEVDVVADGEEDVCLPCAADEGDWPSVKR